MLDPPRILNPQRPLELPLSLVYRPPWLVVLLSAALYAVAAAGTAAIVPATAYRVLLFLLLACHCVFQSAGLLRQFTGPPPILTLSATGDWYLARERKQVPLRLLHNILVHPLVIVLNFHDADSRRHDFVLTRGNCSEHLLRLIRIRLRHPPG